MNGSRRKKELYLRLISVKFLNPKKKKGEVTLSEIDLK